MKSRLVGITCALVVAGAAAQACATNVSLGPGLDEAGLADSGTGPSGFLSPPAEDGGDAEASSAQPETLKECIGTECTWPRATCDDGSIAKCNVDLLSDNDNCGACGHKCKQYPIVQLATQCTNGECQPFCMASALQDCNGLVDDGCEAPVGSDPNNCGLCGNKCPDGVPCNNGTCGCPSGTVNCNGNCVDISKDHDNCGACGNACPWIDMPCDPKELPPNTMQWCSQGQCGKFVCSSIVYKDCNGDLKLGCDSVDGCETDVYHDANNCGKCGNKCAPGQYCRSILGGAPQCLCGPSETACGDLLNPDGDLECVDVATDPKNCGACAHACPTAPNANAVCRSGICGLECAAHKADCNGSWADGCEVDLLSDMRNCGGCGQACDADAGQPCINGSCLMIECDAGGPH